jgi:hypothetical protein
MKKTSFTFGILALAAAASLSHGAIMLSVTETQNNIGSGFDVWDVNVTGLTGADAATNTTTGDFGVSGLAGTFTTNTGGFLTPGKSAAAVQANTSLAGSGDPASTAAGLNTFIDMDTIASFSRTGLAPTTANQHSLLSPSFTTTIGVLAQPPQYIAPTGAQNVPLLAEIVVTHGSTWSYSGKLNTAGGGETDNVTFGTPGPVGTSLTLTGVTAPSTTISGTADSYLPTLLGANGSFTLGGTPDAAGHTLVALDLSGQANYDGLFSSLPAGASQVSDAAAAPILAAFNAADGGSFDVLIDLGAGVPSGTLAITGLPAGVTLNAIAAVPEPTAICLIGIGSALAVSRRRRQA